MPESKERLVAPQANGGPTFITGIPGVGKTTLMERVYNHYKGHRIKVGGIITREAIENGKRVGFRIMDLQSGKEGWLAKAQPGSGPMYGRYCIILEDIETIGVGALRSVVESKVDLILIDEIGPMEMSSRRFGAAISSVLEARTGRVVATFREGSHYPVLDKFLGDPTTTLFKITRDNRDASFDQLIAMLDASLMQREAESG